jgi:uncharacterized C2H2 Zn-finger protein
MARWVLDCPRCGKEFTHSKVEDKGFALGDWPEPKPEFPDGGQSLDCPNCQNTSLYQRHQLTYRAN